MKAILTALVSGTLFGAGLAVAQMTNPAKVIGFLDVAGAWDPSLAFVMGTALAVSALALRLQRAGPTRSDSVSRPSLAAGIDARLLLGASIFGVGWGLAGFCPGPALASLVTLPVTGSGEVLLFVCPMLGGMGIYRLVVQPGAAPGEARAASQHAA